MKSAEFGDGLGFFSFAASAGGKLPPRLFEPTPICLNNLYTMSDAGVFKEENYVSRDEAQVSLDVGHIERTRFDEFSPEWLRTSASPEIINPTGIHLINTRLWISDMNIRYQDRGPITIDTIPPEEWEKLFESYDVFYFMGAYEPSEVSRQHAMKYKHQYPLGAKDPEKHVVASPFAIRKYSISPLIASGETSKERWEKWDNMVETLHGNGKKVVLDFVPNHVAVDHRWADPESEDFHPGWFITAPDQEHALGNPNLYHKVVAKDGTLHYLAHGKDPNFPEWSDTLQLNYANEDLQVAMEDQLLELVDHSDGLRCDMAMLLNADTMMRTWEDHLTNEQVRWAKAFEFWKHAIWNAKRKAREQGRTFDFIAEAYWDTEPLTNFDYIYDGDLYKALKSAAHGNQSVQDVQNVLVQDRGERVIEKRNSKKARYIENHDEERSKGEFGGKKKAKAAAVVAALSPDSMFITYLGQDQGRMIKWPMQIDFMPEEELPDADELGKFYGELLDLKRTCLFQEGKWREPEWEGYYDEQEKREKYRFKSYPWLSWANPNIISQQVEISRLEDDPNRKSEGYKELEIGATVLTNYSYDNNVSCRINNVGSDYDVRVYSLTRGWINDADEKRELGGCFVNLEEWETQVVFYKPKKEDQQEEQIIA